METRRSLRENSELEFIEAVEKALPKGVWSVGGAETGECGIDGFSYNENDIVVFAEG
jgi:hypothetical protein